MAIFNNMRITDKGKILYAKAQAGHELHFTKMRVGAGNVESRNPDTLLDLIDPKYDVGIQSISPNSETKSATISGMINNGAVTEPTYICEIGLYAEDPDEGEILYGYASAGQYGDYYAPSSVGPFTWNYQVIAAIGNAANVTVELSNLVYDYGVINTNTTFIHLSGGNQKEINKSIDNAFTTIFNSGDYIYYCEASGSLNTYRVTIDEYTKKAYTKGMGIAVLINANSTGASTININGIGAVGIKKANGNDVTNLKANAIYTMRYNGANFILQGEGASGNAKSSDLLSGKTAESDNGELVGTIPIKSAQTYVPSTVDQVIQAGQYIGENQIIKGDANLIADNVAKGVEIFGVLGTGKTDLDKMFEVHRYDSTKDEINNTNDDAYIKPGVPIDTIKIALIYYAGSAGVTDVVIYIKNYGFWTVTGGSNNRWDNNVSSTGYILWLDSKNNKFQYYHTGQKTRDFVYFT